jgi:hypothetical protein
MSGDADGDELHPLAGLRINLQDHTNPRRIVFEFDDARVQRGEVLGGDAPAVSHSSNAAGRRDLLVPEAPENHATSIA